MKKNPPVWFFTNERIGNFYSHIEKKGAIKKVFAISSGGDFAFTLLSNPNLKIKNILLCDVRKKAKTTINLKKDYFKKFSYKQLLKNLKSNAFLKKLKKKEVWYKNSFWPIKYKNDYLPYLKSKKRFNCLQKNINKVSFVFGDFNKQLKKRKDNSLDLIYASNILDHTSYCLNPQSYLKTIKEKLNKNGLLFIATQSQSKRKKITKLAQKEKLKIYKKKINRFNPFSGLFGHFSFSFLLFKKD